MFSSDTEPRFGWKEDVFPNTVETSHPRRISLREDITRPLFQYRICGFYSAAGLYCRVNSGDVAR